MVMMAVLTEHLIMFHTLCDIFSRIVFVIIATTLGGKYNDLSSIYKKITYLVK